MAIKLGIVMDPIQSIKIKKDTSFAMLLEAQRRGYELYYMEMGDLYLEQGCAYATMRPIEVWDNAENWFELGEVVDQPLSELDVILMRKDPPFDTEFIYATYMLERAEEAELDLVEIAPTAQPPVCKLMDYGKFKYQESKKKHEAKLKQKQIQVKEVKFRPGTDDGDYNVKLRNLIRFLTDGDKAKITLRFRGREMAHQDIGLALLKRVEADLIEVGTVEQFPKLEGRQMVMMIGPKKK